MIDKFLKAKHWQLFLLTYGIPMILQFAFIGSITIKLKNGVEIEGDPFNAFLGFAITLSLLFSTIYFGWFWSAAVGLQEKVPEHLRIHLVRFKILFILPLIYVAVVSLFVITAISDLEWGAEILHDLPNLIVWILPIHLFSMFCFFHTMYQTAKTIKLAELRREVRFGDFVGEFFLLWFFFVGIWILQPRVNVLAEREIFDKNEMV